MSTQNAPSDKATTNCDDFLTQIQQIKHLLDQDIYANDLKWSLFVAAANSSGYNSKLKPYPNKYQLEHSNEQLLQIIAKVPPLNILQKSIAANHLSDLDTEAIELLHWILLPKNYPTLKTIPKRKHNDVLQSVQSISNGPNPSYIFEVIPNANAIAESKFQQLANGMKTFYAFHGSRIDCFHSILSYGLQQHLCKTALFGEGIYLSSEMHVSIVFSRSGYAWGSSICGHQLSCIAICEVIDNSEHLKYHVKEANNRLNSNKVPDKYFLVTNNDIVRLRYLLVFGQSPQFTATEIAPFQNNLINYLWNHKSTVAIIFYCSILILIGLLNSEAGSYFLHKLNTKL